MTLTVSRIGGTSTLTYEKGSADRLGATVCREQEDVAVNFALYSEHAKSCSLVLFDPGENEPFAELPFSPEMRENNVFAMRVSGLGELSALEYGFRLDGSYNEVRGDRFLPSRIMLDPYARAVSGRSGWGVPMHPDRKGTFRGRIVDDSFDWGDDQFPDIPLKDLIIYEAHVRSMTMHHSSNTTEKGTFSGLIDKIPYLQSLGINCIELLPIFEFDELERNRFHNQKQLYNYWGYSTLNFFSPKSGYASTGFMGGQVQEFKELVKALHAAGIRIVLDVVYNHTAEGDDLEMSYSFKGIDSQTYYISQPDGKYTNYSGCGNTFKCNHPAVQQLILDSLRYWHQECHVDGFRFDLAPILARDTDGSPMWDDPVAKMIAHDPALSDAILIAEPWDAAGLYIVGKFHHWGNWSEWNDRFRDTMRQFINGKAELAPSFMFRMAGSPDIYENCGSQGSINFITCHDGFTLYDLVSYNEKHNVDNGEQNRDGNNSNWSYNNGWEGMTNDGHIQHMRRRKMKSLFALLMLSRGVPMMYAGDEICNTQFGNNNAYCQDNDISWIDWSNLEQEADMLEFVRMMIRFRKSHPVLRETNFSKLPNDTGYPSLSFRYPDGNDASMNNNSHCIAALFAQSGEVYPEAGEEFIYAICNVYHNDIEFRLPDTHKIEWTVITDSSTRNRYGDRPGESVIAEPYTVVLLTGKRR